MNFLIALPHCFLTWGKSLCSNQVLLSPWLWDVVCLWYREGVWMSSGAVAPTEAAAQVATRWPAARLRRGHFDHLQCQHLHILSFWDETLFFLEKAPPVAEHDTKLGRGQVHPRCASPRAPPWMSLNLLQYHCDLGQALLDNTASFFPPRCGLCFLCSVPFPSPSSAHRHPTPPNSLLSPWLGPRGPTGHTWPWHLLVETLQKLHGTTTNKMAAYFKHRWCLNCKSLCHVQK